MTMPFSVRDPKQIAELGISDAISFELTVTDEDSWIDKVKKINPAELRTERTGNAPCLDHASAGALPVSAMCRWFSITRTPLMRAVMSLQASLCSM